MSSLFILLQARFNNIQDVTKDIQTLLINLRTDFGKWTVNKQKIATLFSKIIDTFLCHISRCHFLLTFNL
jgi:hypothetical protein